MFLSIPLCSFILFLNYVTWFFTLLFMVLSGIYVICCCEVKIDLLFLSFPLFCITAFISSVLSFFCSFVITPFALAIISSYIYLICKAEKKFIKWFYFVIQIALIIFAFYFIYSYKEDFISLSFTRLGNKFGDENDIAIFFSLGYFLSFYYIFTIKKIFAKLLYFASLCIFILCGFSTGSKTFLFLMMLTSVLTIFLFFGKKKLYISIIIVAIAGALFVLLLNLPVFSTMKDRFLTMFSTLTNKSIEGTNTSDMSTIGRIQMFLNGLEMFFRKPMFGYGVNGFFVSSSYGGSWSHNHFSETLCSFGIIGTILYHVPFYYGLKGIFDKNKEKKKHIISIVLIFFFIMMMFSVALVSQKIYAYTIGIACAGLNPNTNYEKKVEILNA